MWSDIAAQRLGTARTSMAGRWNRYPGPSSQPLGTFGVYDLRGHCLRA